MRYAPRLCRNEAQSLHRLDMQAHYQYQQKHHLSHLQADFQTKNQAHILDAQHSKI